MVPSIEENNICATDSATRNSTRISLEILEKIEREAKAYQSISKHSSFGEPIDPYSYGVNR